MSTLTDDEKFELLRQCVAFGSANSPYVLTDAEEDELYDFVQELEDAFKAYDNN